MRLPLAAFDIDYGFVKIITGRENGQFQTMQLPSQTHPTFYAGNHDGGFNQRDITFLDIEGFYILGESISAEKGDHIA